MDKSSANLRNTRLADRTISLSVFSVLGSHDSITSSVCPSWTAGLYQTCSFASILSPMFCALLFPALLWQRCLPQKLPHPVKSKVAPPCLTSLQGSGIWTQVPDWVLPQPTVIIFLLMLTPSHRTDEAHTFSFLSKLQWSCGTSFMNSHIHWVPPSGCLFADTLGLGKWKNCFPQVPDWWRKKKSSISWQVLHCAGSDRHSWTWKQRPHCPSIFCSTG